MHEILDLEMFLAFSCLKVRQGQSHQYLQSLPFSRLANRIIASAPNMGGSRKGEGSVLGIVGDMIDGR